jgi:hypothetical protein
MDLKSKTKRDWRLSRFTRMAFDYGEWILTRKWDKVTVSSGRAFPLRNWPAPSPMSLTL